MKKERREERIGEREHRAMQRKKPAIITNK